MTTLLRHFQNFRDEKSRSIKSFPERIDRDIGGLNTKSKRALSISYAWLRFTVLRKLFLKDLRMKMLKKAKILKFFLFF